MANNRIFWAVKAAGFAPIGSTSFTPIHGLQSIGITTTFNLEQVFEIGQIQIYENIEDLPDIEVTLEKVLDGYPLMYHLATRGSATATLAGRSTAQTQLALSIFGDVQDSASGTPVAQCVMSGLYVNSLNYSMPVDGNFTESVTLIGTNKVWKASSFTFTGSIFDNTDTPLALSSGLGGVQRRKDFLVGSLLDGSVSILPGGAGGIAGVSSSGTVDDRADGFPAVKLQNVNVSTDFGRDALNQLGRRNPYFRFVNFPTEVTSEFEIISLSGDWTSATEAGVAGNGNNLTEKTILIVTRDGTKLDLGSKNKLSSVTMGGGDATGGNDTVTYTYTNFNVLTVTHPQDPA